jgi:hypothetical protein
MKGTDIAIATTIKDSWLNVERATIFFRSLQIIALTLARTRVSLLIKPNTIRALPLNSEWNRKTRNTPAVTRVEECTRDDTGVGAAIASGSQAQ